MFLGFPIHPYSVAMIASAVISLLLGTHAWSGTRRDLARSFAFFEFAVFVWSVFRLVQWEIITREGQLGALKLQYQGIVFLPAFFLMFAKALANRPARGFLIALLLAPGCAFLALVATNDIHHYFWVGDSLSSLPINPRAGWAFWAFIAYAYIFGVIAILVIVRAAALSRGIVAHWTWRLIPIFMLPFATNAIFVSFFIGRTGYDPTPAVFAVAGLFIAGILRRFDLLSEVPYRLGVILEAIDEPLLIVDPEGFVVGTNEKAPRVLSNSRALEGRALSEIAPEISTLGEDGDAKECSFGGIDYLISCHTVKRGPERWRGRIYLFKDISALKMVNRELEEARAQADEANATKSAFIAAVSHEMRNPLNAIIGLVDLNIRAAPPPGMLDDLNVILSSGNILLGMVNDLLDLSKIEAGKMEFERIDFDLHEKAASVLRAFRPIAEKKGLFLDIEIKEGTPRRVNGDPLRYGQVLMNLVSNALKFTEHGAVDVGLAPEEGAVVQDDGDPRELLVRTTVTDSGIGIAEDRLPLLFRAFSQADPSVSRRFGGTGLGLSICKKLVELNGGGMEVASVEGQGSVFAFTSRFGACETIEVDAEARMEIAGKGGRSLRVLVVDDDPVNATVARRYISRYGHASTAAGTGAEAIALLAASDVDLVLLDLGLPDMDGFEACRRIRLQGGTRPGGEPPIAAMTARADAGLRAACAAAGMIECLAKPLDPNNLERLLDRVAAKARELGPRAASSVQASRIGIVENAAHIEIAESDAPLIGESSLLARLDEDETFMRELLVIFVDELPGRLEAFKRAAADRDVEALQKLGHALKGSSLSLCAEPLGLSAGALEASCIAAKRSGLASPAAFSSIQARLENLNVLLERTAEAVKAILGRTD